MAPVYGSTAPVTSRGCLKYVDPDGSAAAAKSDDEELDALADQPPIRVANTGWRHRRVSLGRGRPVKYRLGVVLSGGGSRGIAHVGVLRALEERNLRPDCIAGSSAGAAVGALYAAGHSTDRILEFFETRSPFRLSNLALLKPGLIDTERVVADFRDYFPRDSFDALERKLFVTATDIVNGQLRVFETGPVISAILASCAVPMIFSPVEIDGRHYSDGGIINNFPVEPLRDSCEHILGVYASPLRAVHDGDLHSSIAVLMRALEVGMFFASKAKFEDCDVMICPVGLSAYGTFDTRHAREIYRVGYEATIGRIDAIARALA